jgi:PST family polysaccharide transporter
MASLGSFRNFAGMIKSVATLGINNSFIKLFVENKEDKNELGIIYSTFFGFYWFHRYGFTYSTLCR